MKTKLLRKVRKRYSIDYWPYGVTIYGNHHSRCVILNDKNTYWRYLVLEVKSQEEYVKAYDLMYEKLLSWIISDYRSAGVRRISKQKPIKLWYV